MHLSESDRGLLGTGQVDFPAILAALQRIDYTGFLTIEGFGFSPTEITSPGFLWADPGVSPETLAQQGLAYLNTLHA
jgi:D-psicose/D-tagatose/L-ribulose 3-epimerase